MLFRSLIVAGDTKVVEGSGGMFINTAGVGFVERNRDISAYNLKAGDTVIVSGTMGEHHAAILSGRMGIENEIKSDAAPLNEMVKALLDNDIKLHTLRDVTRGGLATVLKELAHTSGLEIMLEENLLPVMPEVKDFCGLLGLDPLYMGNEGKLVAIVAESDSEKAVDIIRKSRYGSNASVIGRVQEGDRGMLKVRTEIGGIRNMDVLQGEGLPRIC